MFDDVTYVDTDRRARRFFGARDDVDRLIGDHRPDRRAARWAFLAQDYREPLADAPHESHDLLVSLYAGLVSEHCTRYLRPGGHLVATTSHGDVALASITPGYELAGAVVRRGDGYRLDIDEPDRWLVPKRPTEVTVESLHRSGRGVAYTRAAAAYLFTWAG